MRNGKLNGNGLSSCEFMQQPLGLPKSQELTFDPGDVRVHEATAWVAEILRMKV